VTRRAIGALAVVLAIGACSVERRPPSVLVRRGNTGASMHRAVLLPSECETATCKGLDAIVAADLAFRGVEIVDLDRIAAVERTRTEVQLATSTEIDHRDRTTASQRRITVHGPLLSDVDVWTMREQLAAMGVDTIVRVRNAGIVASPPRAVVLVRVTRARDASLIWSSVCEIELSALATAERGADQALRCALRGANE
jgi:hypothetical protein